MSRTNSYKSVKKVDSDNREIKQLQENIEQYSKVIDNFTPVDGVLIRDICLEPNTSNEIKHKLGRKPIGWFITRKREDARIWDLQDTNPQPTTSLSIACSHACQIDIWIF